LGVDRAYRATQPDGSRCRSDDERYSRPDDRDRHTIPQPGFNWLEATECDIKGLKVAYTPDWGYTLVDPEVREICGKPAHLFESSLGCSLERASPSWEDSFGPFFTIVLTETDLSGMRKLVEKYRSPRYFVRIARGKAS
jgi:aspartyl-tRNA(Asn)/glutamyl-tRNA(Gln) amidotransferase subunit A